MKKEELVIGETVWFCSTGAINPKPLLFMNKLNGRKVYRFAPMHGNKVFLIHEDRLHRVFKNHDEAVKYIIKCLRAIATNHEQNLERGNTLTAPPLRAFSVVRGFKRLSRIGRK